MVDLGLRVSVHGIFKRILGGGKGLFYQDIYSGKVNSLAIYNG